MIDAVLLSQRIDGDVAGAIAPFITGPDRSVQNTTGGYVGGCPAGLAVSGFVFDSAVKDSNYVGMFYNHILVDSNVGANQVAVSVDYSKVLPTILWKTAVKVRLWKGTKGSIADVRAPFSSGVTWHVGDHMYIDQSHGGQWTNVSAAGCTTSQGRVLVPPASANDVMEAEMFLTVQSLTKVANA